MKRKIPRRYRYKTPVKEPEPELMNETEVEVFIELEPELMNETEVEVFIETEPQLKFRWSWGPLGRLYVEVVDD